MPRTESIDVASVLMPLKDFQRRSVDYVFDRMFGVNPTRRFLLADEVGLGKTLVARGLIAKIIAHLQAEGKDRIDIVYICSNADIARQNIKSLNVTGKEDFQLATRITLLPETVSNLTKNDVNLISFTPTTSFDLRSSMGIAEERWLLYWLLRWTWPALGQGAGAKNVMQGNMSRANFRNMIQWYNPRDHIDADLAARFKTDILRRDSEARRSDAISYKQRFRDLCRRFARSRQYIPSEDQQDRIRFIGELRTRLAATCISALEPDLVILDEFQRFKDLLRDDNPAGTLAKHLFESGDTRVLLVSATPYKMYTLGSETDTDDHYADFTTTLEFLIDERSKSDSVKALLGDYARACARVGHDGAEPLRRVKGHLESTLRQVMCRTEKLAVTEDRSGMLLETGEPLLQVETRELQRYLATARVAVALGAGDVLEYWKASPYLLNFMESDRYKLKRLLDEALENGMSGVATTALAASRACLLDQGRWQQYEQIDPCHALLDRLGQDTVGAGWWRLLWVPPTLPYYRLRGPFADPGAASMTKRLVFSCWHVVPRAISILLSYDAERLMTKSFDQAARNTVEARERRRPLLMFTRSEGRLTGMPVLALLYPAVRLSALGNPLSARDTLAPVTQISLETILARVEREVTKLLAPLIAGAPESGPEDEAWYWAAPILLDRRYHEESTATWFASSWSPDGEEAKGWREHVAHAQEAAEGRFVPRGRPPKDLAHVLALLAVAGPANCALRALVHTLSGSDYSNASFRNGASRVAWGLRSLFNTPEVTSLVRGMNGDEPYWRRVLEYCADGCLQSVLDEYAHMLAESVRLADLSPEQAADAIATIVMEASSLRAATPGVDWVKANGSGGFSIRNQRARARFAMRFGDEHGEGPQVDIRKDTVRAAFNSPFWPFVLATTSIGQEGLDFHPYCHAVVHWNLPSNPVDLEQREGRVHRYKGHAVRKNVAAFALRTGAQLASEGNPWDDLFKRAAQETPRESDIKPYWVFPLENGAVIERHAPVLPLSREAARLPELRRSLAIYRMVFGQPRQDDLLEHLKRTVRETELERLSRELCIDLEPHASVSPKQA